MNDAGDGFIRVGALGELRDHRRIVVSTPGGPVLVVADGDEVVALDNRCPHMGFPLHRGSIEDGILTCHWHHARFDLRSGSTFDLWADDVPIRAVRIVEGEVWVAATPAPRDEAAHWRQRLHDGLAHNISLVIGKAVLGATAAGVPATELARDTLLYGATHRDRWGVGLTTEPRALTLNCSRIRMKRESSLRMIGPRWRYSSTTRLVSTAWKRAARSASKRTIKSNCPW